METLPIINQTYELYKFAVSLNDQAPKRWRFSLGQSLEKSILDCLGELIMAKGAPKELKPAMLLRADSMLKIIVLKLRLVLELKIANETKIFVAQAKIREIGRMLGGWLKSTQSA